MNSSEHNFFEDKDNNPSNTESSNTQDDSNEQDDKNIESLFESPNFPNQSSDDDLMSLFANSGMLEEKNMPEMMPTGAETELFNPLEMAGETSEMDLFNTPEMMSMGAETDLFNPLEMAGETSEMDLFNTPEMMSMGAENTDLLGTPEMMSMGSEISEIDLLLAPEMMSMGEGENTGETDLFNTPEMMSMGGENTDFFDTPEMMSMEENTDLLATPEMMSMEEAENTSETDLLLAPEMMSMGEGENTGETDLFNTPEMMSMGGENTDFFDTPEMMSMEENTDLLATPEMMSMGEAENTSEMDLLAASEMMSMSGELDSNQSAEMGGETSETNLLAYHDLVPETDDISQFTEVTPNDRELDSSQQPEIAEETNDMNLGLGIAAIATGASIPLLEERLIVDVNKQKIGEVVVRKEIETEMVQVPVRREKLIVEQVGEETIQLAEIDLGQSEIQGVEIATSTTQAETVATGNEIVVAGEFTSAKIASLLLNAIALERRQGCTKIRVEIVVDDVERQQTYQEWVDRCSVKPSW